MIPLGNNFRVIAMTSCRALSLSIDINGAAMITFLLLSVILVGCVETTPLPAQAYVLDGIPICGRAQTLSKSQIRAAIAEDRQWSSQQEDKIYSVEVASSVEVYVYHTKRNKQLEEYNILRLVEGRWKVQERMITGPALLGPTI
jgi:hypothetical protein